MNNRDKSQMRRKYANKGFTLMEMIVVIVIIGILLAILVPGIIKYVSKAKATACQVNKRELLHELYYEVGVDSEMLKQDKLQKYADNSGIKCSEGDNYKVKLIVSDSGVPDITLTCKVHDEETKTISQDLLDRFTDFTNVTPPSAVGGNGINGNYRKQFYESNGNKWPELIVDATTYYIQPYYKKDGNVWLFATTDNGIGSVGNINWNVPFLQDPTTGKWYRSANYNGTGWDAKSINSYADVETLHNAILNEKRGDKKGNKWVEVTEFDEKN